MKKKLIVALSTAAVAAMALPALADHTINGYFRTIMTMENYNLAEKANPDRVVDQRLRARWQNTLNEYVTVVWFGEIDNVWGKQGKGAIGGGGKQGTDGVDIETKHAFLDVKVPGAPMALSGRLGLQPVNEDGAFSDVIMDDDMAAVTFNMKNDMVGLNFGWSKLDEGANADNDDSDLYFVKAALAPMPGLKLSPQIWYANNQRTVAEDDNRQDLYVGLSGSFALAPLDLSAWVIYQTGKDENADEDYDVNAWAISAKAAMDVAGVKLGLRGMYFPASTDEDDQTFYTPANGNNGLYEFADEGLLIFLADALAMSNTNTGRRALIDAAYSGYGLMGGVLSASYVPPAVKELSLKASLGYFQVADKSPKGLDEIDGSSLGTEVAVQAFYKIAERVDVGFRGAYAFLGNAYNGSVDDGDDDPADLYKAEIVVNVPY